MRNNKRIVWGSIFNVANIGFIVFIIVSKLYAMPKVNKITGWENAYKAKKTKAKEWDVSYKDE